MYKERKFFLQGGQISLFSGGSNLYEQAVFYPLLCVKTDLRAIIFAPPPLNVMLKRGRAKKNRARAQKFLDIALP